jgi:hypothetical protein
MWSGIDAPNDGSAASLVDRLSRYDLVLLVVPAALGACAFADVPLHSALSAASLLAAAVVADGLFRRPPRPTVDHLPAD